MRMPTSAFYSHQADASRNVVRVKIYRWSTPTSPRSSPLQKWYVLSPTQTETCSSHTANVFSHTLPWIWRCHMVEFSCMLCNAFPRKMFTILNIFASLEQWITPMHRYAFLYSENGRFVRLHSCWVTNVTGARRFSLPIGDSVCSKLWWSGADAFLLMQWDTHLHIIADRYFVHPTDESRVAKSKQIFQAKKLQKPLESAWKRPVI